MKPIGTITKYYTFVDDGTEETLDTLMIEATDLQDFVSRLGEKVYREAVSPSLVLIAAILAWKTQDEITRQKIESKYKDSTIVKPWTLQRYPVWNQEGLVARNRFKRAVNRAIDSQPESWVLMELYLLFIEEMLYVLEGSHTLDKARTLIEQCPELHCYKADIFLLEAEVRCSQGDTKSAIPVCQEGLEHARMTGDVFLEIGLLIRLGFCARVSDGKRALDLTEEAYRLSKETGIPVLSAIALNSMGSHSRSRGEYDLALESYSESMNVLVALGQPDSHVPIEISFILSELGDGREALEWATMALESEREGGPGGMDSHACPLYAMAYALILLGKTEEADAHLDAAYEISLRAGHELQIGRYFYLSGLSEIAKGDSNTGIQTIERALEIFRRIRSQFEVTRCLLALTKAEIDTFEIQHADIDPTDSGSWMVELEREANEKDLPGILIQHALLKAQFQEKIGQTNAARETLKKALTICDNPGVRTLQTKVKERANKLDTTASAL